MSLEEIAQLVLSALEELEGAKVISIGGWDPAIVNQVLTALGNVLKALPRPDDGSPNNPGLGPLSAPSGTSST